jgi:hypothetical protein
MKAYLGVDVEIHIFLTSAIVGGERLDLLPGRFTPGERAHVTHWIGGWVDPQNQSGRRILWRLHAENVFILDIGIPFCQTAK